MPRPRKYPDELLDRGVRLVFESQRPIAQWIAHAGWGVPGQALAGLVVEPSPQVLDFQADLIAAITPFVASGGTAAAYVTDAEDPDTSGRRAWRNRG
jgi:hypothetical protein